MSGCIRQCCKSFRTALGQYIGFHYDFCMNIMKYLALTCLSSFYPQSLSQLIILNSLYLLFHDNMATYIFYPYRPHLFTLFGHAFSRLCCKFCPGRRKICSLWHTSCKAIGCNGNSIGMLKLLQV